MQQRELTITTLLQSLRQEITNKDEGERLGRMLQDINQQERSGTGEMVHLAHASVLFEMLFSIWPCLEYRARPEMYVWNAERRNEVLAAWLNSLINP